MIRVRQYLGIILGLLKPRTMVFLKYNRVNGNTYALLVESYRPTYGSSPKHRVLKYIGSVDGTNRFSKNTKIYEPMRPSFAEKLPKYPKDFIYQVKEDGVRTIGYFNKKGQAFINRRNVNKTEIYPELKDLYKKLNFKDNLVLDGEIVALRGGKSDFKTLSERDRLKDKLLIYQRSKTHPLEYHVFDILAKDGRDLTDLPLEERKRILDKVIPDNLKKIKEVQSGSLKRLLEIVKKRKEEGIILKRKDSKYEEGKLSKNWQKLKLLKENDAVILGVQKGTGKRESTFGAILTGVYDHESGKYRYTGKIGTGFTDGKLKELKQQFDKLKTAKPPEIINLPKEKDVTFLKPELVARVRFLQLTKDNIMREGRFLSIREDITPQDTHISKVQSFKLPKKSLGSLSSKLIEVEKKGRIVKTRKPEEVLKIAKEVEKEFRPLSQRLDLAGSIRRKKNPVDIDVVLIPKDKQSIINKLEEIKANILSKGDKKIEAVYDGVKTDFFFTTPKSYGAALMTRTGPMAGNLGNRSLARNKGLILNEYGLFKRTKEGKSGRYIAGKTEKGIYEALGKTYRPPEERGLPR